jgi:hypothetical protein
MKKNYLKPLSVKNADFNENNFRPTSFLIFYFLFYFIYIVQAALFAIDKLEKGVGLKEPVVRLFQPAG